MTRLRAFTLIEAMVTLAIAGIISAAAAAAMSLIMRSVATTRVNVSVATNLANSVQFISRDIENAGGQGMPTQAGLIIENDDNCDARDTFPDCNGSDRITVITALEEPPICTVRAGSSNRLSFQYGQGGCCFPSKLASDPVFGVAMLTRSDGSFRPVTITGETLTACEFNVADLLPQELYLNNPVAAVHEAVPLTDFTSFIGGQVTLVQVRTYYLNAAHELRVRTGAGATAEDALVTDEIWDLQMAVGLDIDNDGTVAATEWAFRGATGVASDLYATRLFAPRQVEVSVVQGVPSTSGNGMAVSPLRTGSQTVPGEGRAMRAGVALLTPYNSMLRVKP